MWFFTAKINNYNVIIRRGEWGPTFLEAGLGINTLFSNLRMYLLADI